MREDAYRTIPSRSTTKLTVRCAARRNRDRLTARPSEASIAARPARAAGGLSDSDSGQGRPGIQAGPAGSPRAGSRMLLREPTGGPPALPLGPDHPRLGATLRSSTALKLTGARSLGRRGGRQWYLKRMFSGISVLALFRALCCFHAHWLPVAARARGLVRDSDRRDRP
jgi:hypothetical protein